MDWLQIALRLVHIIAGILWAGGAALFFFYIEPTINKLGPDAEKFVDEVINRRKAPIYFAVMSTLTVLGGVLMYWRDTGLDPDVMGQTKYLVFGLGGLCAIAAWLGGNLFITPAVKAVAAIGGEMKAAGGPPTAELIGRMHAAQERLRRIGLVDLVLIFAALAGMATARYFV